MADWAGRAWPPSTADLGLLLLRAAETFAIALVGTTLAGILALASCTLAARNITTNGFLRLPTRWFLNTLRGIDSFVFAILFVAAVGLGPFRRRGRHRARAQEQPGPPELPPPGDGHPHHPGHW